MPLAKDALTAAILAIMQQPGQAPPVIAEQLSTAIDTFVKSGTVNVSVSIPSTGSPGAPSAGTGTGSVT